MKKVTSMFLAMFLFVICGSLVGCCGMQHTVSYEQTAHPPAGLIDDIKEKTVALIFKDSDGDTIPLCTGVWVGDDLILTANHCADGIAEINELPEGKGMIGMQVEYIVEDEAGNQYDSPKKVHNAVVVSLNHGADLALLKTMGDVPWHKSASIAKREPEVGTRLHVVGHVVGLYWTYVPASLAAIRPKGWYRTNENIDIVGPYIEVAGPVWKGNSGGGCFDDEGRLLGIASFIVSAPGISFFISVDAINPFLEESGYFKG